MNILIVDDLAINLRLLRAQLEAEGFTVWEAEDGVAALKILNEERVDLIISDILMPRMDGYHLCTEVRKNEKFATLPFIVYTATYISPSDEKLSLELGADYFLRKPASVAEIKQTIETVTSEQHRHSPGSIRGTDDITVMKEYNTALVGKLEQKLVELEETQKGLAASEERYRRIVETAEEGIWTVDAQERTTYVNPKVAAIFGYTTEEMMAGSFFDFMPKAFARLARAGLKRRRTESLSNSFDFKFRRKDGSDFWALVASKPIFSEVGEYIGSLAMITDIDDRKKFEEKLLASEKQNRALYLSAQKNLGQTLALREIDKAITNSLDLKFTLDIVLTQVINELQVDAADILVYDRDLGILEFLIAKGFRTSPVEGARVSLGRSFAGRAILELKRIDIPDLGKEAKDFLRYLNVALEDFVDYHVVPLLAKGKVLGVLGVFKRSAFEADPEWLNFLETLAGQAAIAIDNISLIEDLHLANSQLVLGYDATIEGWSRALDLRDKETEGHTQRVTALAINLARQMGVRREELVNIRRGGLLHDIGKMGVPDSILLKPGQLTDDEWIVMKKHPQYAYDMLSPIMYLRDALDIPYYHHEKWDGSGYPLGLKAEAIPLAARIFAVVDVYDALISDRPYRKAWGKKRALDHILDQSGTHFDPRVAKAFLETEFGGNRLSSPAAVVSEM